MPAALGRHSPVLDEVRLLRSKAGRRDRDRYAIEGPTLLAEALAAGCEPELVLATEAALAALAPSVARRLDARLAVVSEPALARVSDLETPPGLLAVLPRRFTQLADVLVDGEPVLVLAEVADPGNAGTLLRTAEIFGISRAVFARTGVEPYNPKVVRAAMGATFRTAIAVVDAPELAAAAAVHRYRFVATAVDGEPLPRVRFPRRALLAIGNERRGVGSWYPGHDLTVAIPQRGGGESLNAAVAGGIILYAFSQRQNDMLEGVQIDANP